MHNLTQRQVEILKSLIEEYIETALPVGSETLEKKHNMSASPATIRNEMVSLTKLGYLRKTHSSSGRVPTASGMKFYVKQLMKEKDLSVSDEVALKEKVWDVRDKESAFLKKITKSLAVQTKALAITTTSDGDFFCSGYANILDMPEFFDIDITKNLLNALDEYEYFQTIFNSEIEDGEIHILLGEELGPRLNGPYGFVFTHYETQEHLNGEVGILGPVRLRYQQVVPMVRYAGNLIEEIATGW